MRCVGIDIASVGLSSLALAIDGVPYRAIVHKPDKKTGDADRLLAYYKWLRFQFFVTKPDIVAVEQISGGYSRLVVHALSLREGVALLAAKQSGALVLNPGISSSRRVVFDAGNFSKDDAWVAFRKMYPDLKLRVKTHGGLDQMDAFTHALAAPSVLERR